MILSLGGIHTSDYVPMVYVIHSCPYRELSRHDRCPMENSALGTNISENCFKSFSVLMTDASLL